MVACGAIGHLDDRGQPSSIETVQMLKVCGAKAPPAPFPTLSLNEYNGKVQSELSSRKSFFEGSTECRQFTCEDIRRQENVAIRTPIRRVVREHGLSDTFIHARISM